VTDSEPTATTDRERLDYESEETSHVCQYCGRPFAREDLLALHRGHAHFDSLAGDQREAFEAAYADEQEEIRLVRLKALGALILLYFGFLILYAVV